MPAQARTVIPPRKSESDEDEQTLYSPSEDDSENYDDDAQSLNDDHDILESEDEREKLLTRREGGFFSRKDGVKIGKREEAENAQQGEKSRNRKEKRSKRESRSEEHVGLMYEMDQMGARSSTDSLESQRRSSESDDRRLKSIGAQRKTQRKRICHRFAIYFVILVVFLILLFIAYRVSGSRRVKSTVVMLSNGTSLFAPTTILISLDGFRADFLYRGLTPTLSKFIAEGVSPKYMLPSFPSVTFPNHYTMATGLYPEAHGIVGNTFWDPVSKEEFYYTDTKNSMEKHWWGGEPLWQTAERQSVKVAVHMWPGSEMHDPPFMPAYVDKYNGSEALPNKVNRIMDWLDLPGPKDVGMKVNQPRPQLIAAYVPNVDSDGHRYGPNSTEIRQTIKNADAMLGDILKGLQERNLTNIVNVVVVSDHGMATTDTSRLIQLESLVDPSELEHIDGWPHYGLRPKNPADLERLHKDIVKKAENMTEVEIYLRDKDMPERYHFSRNDRIAPLWIIPKAGWAIIDKSEGDVKEMKKNGDVYHPRGIHGYDHEHPLMRAIFVARGPAFPHLPGSKIEPFQNINLYNMICDSINISPAPNNGTLRLPLRPIGLHSDNPGSSVNENETPPDPPISPSPTPSLSPAKTIPAATPITSTPSPTSSAAEPEESGKHEQSWWEWLTHKADGVESWVTGFLEEHVHGGKAGKGEDGGKARD